MTSRLDPARVRAHWARIIRARIIRARGDRDLGAATIFVVSLAIVLFVAAGLVVDGGLAINARERVADDAEQAARAGAQQIDLPALRAGGTVAVDPGAASTAAINFLIARGYSGSDATVSAAPDAVQVSVNRQVGTALLSLIGIQTFTVRASATARPAAGVTAEIP